MVLLLQSWQTGQSSPGVTHSVVTALQSKTNLGACRKLKPHGTPRDPERWLCGHVGRSRGRWRQLPCKASAEERRAGSSHRSCIRSCPGLSCFVTRVLALSTRVPALACQHSRASTRVLSTHSNEFFRVCILVNMLILI